MFNVVRIYPLFPGDTIYLVKLIFFYVFTYKKTIQPLILLWRRRIIIPEETGSGA